MQETGKQDAYDVVDRGNPLAQWRELGQILIERRWLAITVFAIVFTGTALWTFRQSPRYRAAARIQVDMARQNVLNMPDVAGTEPIFLYNHYVNTLVTEITSLTFADRIARVLIEQGAPGLPHDESLPQLIMAAVDARAEKDSRLITITAEHRDPVVAALLANTVADQFVELGLERRVKSASEAVTWLREQVVDQRQKLTTSETALRDYRDKTRTVSLEQRQDIVVAKLKSISESLTAAELERVSAESNWREVEEKWSAGVPPREIAAIAGDPAVSEVRLQLLNKQADMGVLTNRYKAHHPIMKQLLNETDGLEQKYLKACAEARARITARYEQTRSSEEGLRQALHEQEEQALSLDRLLMQYEELKRIADADRELYDAVITRLKETDLAGKMETNNLGVIDRAHTPERPFKPQRVLNLVRGGAAGLVLGILLALLAHLMDDRVRRPNALGESFGVPLLAVIPKIESQEVGDRARVVAVSSASIPAEAFRSLRANLMMSPLGRQVKLILVTGTGAGDGKSLVASNLAIVLASNGERTLLLDADLRRPTVERTFPGGGEPGPHPLTHNVALSEAARVTSVPNLWVLPAAVTSNPADLLASPRMDTLLAEAAAGFDRVILDCPPLFGVSDPLILLPRVGGVILVARHKKTRHGPIQDAIQRLQTGSTPIVGVVLNSVDWRAHGYYYSNYGAYYGEGERGASGWQRFLNWVRKSGQPRVPAAPTSAVASAHAPLPVRPREIAPKLEPNSPAQTPDEILSLLGVYAQAGLRDKAVPLADHLWAERQELTKAQRNKLSRLRAELKLAVEDSASVT